MRWEGEEGGTHCADWVVGPQLLGPVETRADDRVLELNSFGLDGCDCRAECVVELLLRGRHRRLCCSMLLDAALVSCRGSCFVRVPYLTFKINQVNCLTVATSLWLAPPSPFDPLTHQTAPSTLGNQQKKQVGIQHTFPNYLSASVGRQEGRETKRREDAWAARTRMEGDGSVGHPSISLLPPRFTQGTASSRTQAAC